GGEVARVVLDRLDQVRQGLGELAAEGLLAAEQVVLPGVPRADATVPARLLRDGLLAELLGQFFPLRPQGRWCALGPQAVAREALPLAPALQRLLRFVRRRRVGQEQEQVAQLAAELRLLVVGQQPVGRVLAPAGIVGQPETSQRGQRLACPLLLLLLIDGA